MEEGEYGGWEAEREKGGREEEDRVVSLRSERWEMDSGVAWRGGGS
jgi:hypothetical protein